MSTPITKSKPLSFISELDFTGLNFRQRDSTVGATVHCSATKPSMNWGAIEMDRVHRQQGWLCIGYHFVIDRNGLVHKGRPMDTRGAHCSAGNRNRTHVSVCLAGGISRKPVAHVPGSPWNGSDAECNFTPAQGVSLRQLLDYLKETYGFTDEAIEGHRDVKTVRKACPSFNVKTFLGRGVFELD